MFFDKDIAVFQSAFHLIEKTKGTVSNVKKNQDEKIRKILGDAGREIIQGLRRDNSEEEKYNSKFRLLSLMTALALKEDKSDVDEFWFPLINDLPSLSEDILFDFVKDCDLSLQLFHMLSHINTELGHELLTNLTIYIEQSTDETDRQLVVDMCEYLFLVENPYVFQSESQSTQKKECHLSEDQLKLCDEISKLYLAKKEESNPQAGGEHTQALISRLSGSVVNIFEGKFSVDLVSLTLLMCSANAVACMLTATGFTVKNSDFLLKPLSDFVKKAPFKTILPEKEAKKFFIFTQDEYFAKDNLRKNQSPIQMEESAFTLLKNLLGKSMEPFRKYTRLDDLITDFITKTEQSDKNQAPATGGKLSLKANSRAISRTTRQPVISLSQLYQILKNLGGALGGQEGFKATKDWFDQVTSSGSKSLDEVLGDRAIEWCIVAIKAKLYGRQEVFSQCLRTPIPDKILPKWMNCVEGNLSMINSTQAMVDWFTMLDNMTKGKHKSMTVASLRMLGLAAFKKLPLSFQGEVILLVYEKLDIKRVFSGQDQLRTKVTSTFNRLVKSQGDSKSAAILITELLLQTPEETFKKMVHAAVYNNGQAKLMAEIFRTVPQVCRMKSRSQMRLLGCQIYEAVKWNLSQAEERNLLSFIGSLLSKCTDEDLYLIPPMELMENAVFPNLCPGIDAPVPISRTLGILESLLENIQDQAWLSESHCVPLIVFLVEMLDSYSVLFDSELIQSKHGNVLLRASIKEQVISLLETLQKGLINRRQNIQRKQFTWIYNSLLKCHWTTSFHLLPLLGDSNASEIKMRVPEVLGETVELPDHWKLFPVEGFGSPYIQLLDFVRVSSSTKEIVLTGLKTRTVSKQGGVYDDIITDLSLLLPQSVSKEWERLMEIFLSLRNNIFGPLTDYLPLYPGLDQPDVKDAEDGLHLVVALSDVLHVLSESVLCENNPDMNTHIAKCYVSTLKTFCLHQDMLNLYQKDLQLYILAALFCHLCYQMQLFPNGTAEPLYVLILDVLQTYTSNMTELEEKSPGEARKMKIDQMTVMKEAAQHCPTEEKELLSKKISIEMSKDLNEP